MLSDAEFQNFDRLDRIYSNTMYGKLGGLNRVELVNWQTRYSPGMLHRMHSDPCDNFDGWRWSFTNWVTEDSDPCDDWYTYFSFGKYYPFADEPIRGLELKLVEFDDIPYNWPKTFAESKHGAPKSHYDYTVHNKVRRKRW